MAVGATIRSLVTRILFKSDETGLKKVETNTRAAKRQMRAASRAAWQLKRDLRGMMIGMKGLIAVMVGGRVAKFFTADFAKATDEQVKFSKAIGVTLQRYQGLTHAVQLSGGNVGDMNKALTQLAKRSLEANQGLKTQQRAFDQLGVSIKDSKGNLKSVDVLLPEMADKFKAMKNTSERTGLAMQLFGRTGAKLMPMFLEGSKGIEKMIAEAERLGITLTEDQARIAENYNDEMLRAKSVLTGLRNQIALKLLPSITKNMRAFQLWAREGDNLKRMLERIILVAKAAAAALALFAAVKFGQNVAVMIGVLKKLVFWIQLSGKAALITQAKFLLWAIAIGLIVLAVQDVISFVQGKESILGDWLGDKDVADAWRKGLLRVWDVMRTIGRWAKRIGRALWELFLFQHKIYTALWREFGPSIKALGRALVAFWRELWPVIVEAANMIRDAMQQVWIGLTATWTALKPTLIELKKALLSIWVEVKPGLVALWRAWLKIQGLMWRLIKFVLPWIGKAAKANWAIFATAVKGTISVVTVLVKMLTMVLKMYKRIAKAASGLLSTATGGLLGGEETTLDLTKVRGAAPRPGLTPAGGVSQSSRVTVGALNVNVQGTADMNSPEMQAAVRRGAREGLQEQITETFQVFRPVVGVGV